MRRISTAVIALLFVLTGSASADTAETETVGEFLLSMPAHSVEPVIDYCSEQVPAIKNDLLKERKGLIDKLTAAGKPLMEELRNDPEFNAPVQDSMRQEVVSAHSHAMKVFQQEDPNIICRTALENIQNATVDGLRKVVEDTYQKFRGAGQVRNSK